MSTSMSQDNTFKVGWLFPNTLYLHGERGNILALVKLAREMDMNLEIEKIELGEKINILDYDILFCPPGELLTAPTVIEELKKYSRDLKKFIESGRIILATGTSLGLFGKQIKRTDGSIIEGLGLIDITCTEKSSVYGDDLIYKAVYHDTEYTLSGNQIQMVDIDIGNEKPFGKLVYGYGNTGETKFEGVLKNNSIFTNTLGPLLVLNPWLTKSILDVVRENHGLDPYSKKMKFPLETSSLKSKINYTKNKKKCLKNTQEA